MRGERERGQALVLFALLLMLLLGAAALVVDGGYGFVQLRQSQNAADLASEAATQQLVTVCAGGAAPTNAAVSAVIADLVAANAPLAAGDWSGTYLDDAGSAIAGAAALPASAGQAPADACGVQVRVAAHWNALLSQLLGVARLAARASAAAVVGATPHGAPVGDAAGIVALAPTGTHTIWGGGSGQFAIQGNLIDDSTGDCATGCYADTIDDFGSSGTQISGVLESVAQMPLDPCFDPAGPTSATCARHTSGTITYGGGLTGGLPYQPDPLAYVPVPTEAEAACPGQAVQVYTGSPGTTLEPGVYDYPVAITGSATFADCGGSPGVYIFNQGLQVCPGAGAAVTGSDVLLYSAGSGSGSGGPCGSPARGGPGSGPDGIYLGGQGTVTLSGPQSGAFSHLLLYQNRAVAANLGLDNHTADSATISLTGAVYDNSLAGGQGGVLASGGGSGGGQITLDGIAVVDSFATGGTANVQITFDASQVPGVGAVLVR